MSQPWPRDSNETASDQPGTVQTRADRSCNRRYALRPALEHAVFPEGGAAIRPIRVATRILARIEYRIKHTEPAFDGLIAADWRYQEIAGPGRGDIGHSDGFRLITAQLFAGGFQQLDRSGTA
jgi:hypothetical protein